MSVLKLTISFMFFLNIIGAYTSGLRNSCSIFRACFFIHEKVIQYGYLDSVHYLVSNIV